MFTDFIFIALDIIKCLQDCVLDSVNGPLPNWHINPISGTCLRVESPQNLSQKKKKEIVVLIVHCCVLVPGPTDASMHTS